MDFKYSKLIVLSAVMVLGLPFLALAAPRDYLQINLSYDRIIPKVEILSVVQVTQEPVYAHLQNAGTYTLTLLAKNKVLSQNSFSLPEGEMEVLFTQDGQRGGTNVPVPDSSTMLVYLPLTESHSPKELSLQLAQGQTKLWEKSLDTLPFRRQSVVQYQVDLPSLTLKGESELSQGLLGVVIGIGIIILIGLVVFAMRKRQKTKQVSPPNPELISYITQSRAAGQTDQEIKQALVSAGWPEKEINQTLKSL